jgi:N,N'-diacetyllegionaminate synthase
LNVIQELKERYKVPVGFSDHSARMETCIAATALGASILEFHVVFDRQLFGPDAKASLTIQETKELVLAVKNIAAALSNPIDKNSNTDFSELKQIFEKSLAVNKKLPKNHVITFEDLEAKKPKGYGLDASRFQEVIGKVLNRDLNQWDFLNEGDLL